MSNFKELMVWNKSIELVTLIYQILSKFPKTETYWLVDQIKRSSVSIPSNIAEGNSRTGAKTYLQFLSVAKWSIAELETQIIISRNLWFIDNQDFETISLRLNEINKMLAWLFRTIQNQK